MSAGGSKRVLVVETERWWLKTRGVRVVCGVGESSDEAGGDVMWRFKL
jgi:hypothetical protein